MPNYNTYRSLANVSKNSCYYGNLIVKYHKQIKVFS
jgi:hypothetical protein